MGLFTDGFKLLKKASEPLYKTPKSIQETIEIMAVAENGIFEVSKNKYSKCYRFQDINYTTATEDEQIGIFERYCKFLNSLDCNYKITINNKNKNMDELRDKVLIAEKNDGFNNYRRIYNDIIEEKIIEGRQGIEQERYLTITIERKNFEEAKAQFATLEATIHKAFIELGAEIVPLNGNERLKVLYDYYHLGDEGSFDFDIKKAKKVGADFRNDLCNGMVKYFPDHFEDESKFCKALFIKKYPSSLSDRFINEITSLPVHSITSIDVVPVPKDLTTKVLQKKYLGIESDIIKQQRVRNKNNDFSTEISYAKRTEKKEIEEIMDDVRENDQCLFFVGVTIILMAESKKELDSVCETVETIGKRNSCTIDTHYLKQREDFVPVSRRMSSICCRTIQQPQFLCQITADCLRPCFDSFFAVIPCVIGLRKVFHEIFYPVGVLQAKFNDFFFMGGVLVDSRKILIHPKAHACDKHHPQRNHGFLMCAYLDSTHLFFFWFFDSFCLFLILLKHIFQVLSIVLLVLHRLSAVASKPE